MDTELLWWETEDKEMMEKRRTENVFGPLPLPSSVLVPMCFCGDPCKVAKSDEDDMYRQRYWMCFNFAFEPTLRQRRINKIVRN